MYATPHAAHSSQRPELGSQDQRPAVWPRRLNSPVEPYRFVVVDPGDEQTILVMIDRSA